MRLCVNKLTALRLLRSLRAGGGALSRRSCDLAVPDPAPRVRWTAGLVEELLGVRPSAQSPAFVAVPRAEDRIQAAFAKNTVYSTGLPTGSFLDVGEGLLMPCPELLFVEMGTVMTPEAHALLGYELCGTYARDPNDPRCGAATFGIAPVTTVARIRAFLGRCRRVRGATEAASALGFVADNAWSPMEAIVALLATMSVVCLGYGLGTVQLNVRHKNASELVELGVRETRVPDIEVEGLPVGFNYDGHEHFGPDSLSAPLEIREKYLDDLRRNRELAAQGRIVLPVASEDLFSEGGLDTVMLEAALAAEELGLADSERFGTLRRFVRARALRRERQRLIWSLLPWPQGAQYARQLAAPCSVQSEQIAYISTI